LLDELRFGQLLDHLTPDQRDSILIDIIGILLAKAREWLERQHLKIVCSREAAPGSWVGEILQQAQGRSGGRVEQHLIGAKLTKAHPNAEIPIHAGTTADVQTGRSGDFQVGTTVYHVTAAPGDSVIEKCKSNYHAGFHPVLLVPAKDKVRAEMRAEDLGMYGHMTILAIEDFVAVNIIELSEGNKQKFIEVIKGMIEEYNRRIDEVETDKSLKIDVQ
jgi:hypothetical protein